jgi:hypothetical protein
VWAVLVVVAVVARLILAQQVFILGLVQGPLLLHTVKARYQVLLALLLVYQEVV